MATPCSSRELLRKASNQLPESKLSSAARRNFHTLKKNSRRKTATTPSAGLQRSRGPTAGSACSARHTTARPPSSSRAWAKLLPIAALLRTGHKIQVALGGHDAACFDRYGPPAETFTVHLGDHSTLDLPVLAPQQLPGYYVD